MTYNRLLLYAHFSQNADLSPYVYDALDRYRPYASTLILISTSPFSPAHTKILESICDRVIVRNNIGYDFGSWQQGLKAAGPLDQFDEIVLANDSMIGPFEDPGPMFDRLTTNPNSVCGLTLNWQYGKHVQSYFVRYKKSVVKSGAFDEFWHDIRPTENKLQTILNYEVGLTNFMEARGHSIGALFALPEINPLPKRLKLCIRSFELTQPLRTTKSFRHLIREPRTNPVHYLWEDLFNDGIHLVKKELIRDNPLYTNKTYLLRQLSRRSNIPIAQLLDYASS